MSASQSRRLYIGRSSQIYSMATTFTLVQRWAHDTADPELGNQAPAIASFH